MTADQPAKPVAQADQKSFFRKWSILVVLSLALAIIIIDTTVLNVSLKTIILDLHTSIQSLQWVISAYTLTLSALTITGGRLGDIFGRKRMFMLGAAIFAAGSLIASLSTSAGMLLAGESIVEGIGAALMMPATASLLVSHYQGRDRAVAFGFWGGIIGAAAAVGPILGGYLTTNYSWRWAFRINVGVAALLLIGSILIAESRDREEAPKLDWLGVALSATGLLGVVYGVIEASTFGWFKATQPFALFGHSFAPWGLSVTPVAVAAGVAVLGLFALWQGYLGRHGKTPLVSLKIFANRQFAAGTITTGIMSLGQVGLIFAVPVFLQAVRGLDAFHTGLALLPMSLTLLIAAPLAGLLGRATTPKRLIQIGLFVNLIAITLLYLTLNADSTTASLIPGLAIYGLGMGFVISPISNLTLSAVSVEEAGEASGINNTMRQVGATLGSAILGAVLISSLASHLTSGINASTVIPTDAKTQLATLASHQTSSVEFGPGVVLSAKIPAVVKDEIVRISHEATAAANRQDLIFMSGFMILALIAASVGLPNTKNIERGQSAAVGH